MPRFISWLTVGVAAGFLVVASGSFDAPSTKWLAFAISIGTLVVAAGVAYRYRRHVASLVTGLLAAAISAWTIVASLVFSDATVSHLALASSLAISGLAVIGLTVNEVSLERAASSARDGSGKPRSSLSAAA
jgi:hypothetical protein